MVRPGGRTHRLRQARHHPADLTAQRQALAALSADDIDKGLTGTSRARSGDTPAVMVDRPGKHNSAPAPGRCRGRVRDYADLMPSVDGFASGRGPVGLTGLPALLLELSCTVLALTGEQLVAALVLGLEPGGRLPAGQITQQRRRARTGPPHRQLADGRSARWTSRTEGVARHGERVPSARDNA